jgi:hypothetical protein
MRTECWGGVEEGVNNTPKLHFLELQLLLEKNV